MQDYTYDELNRLKSAVENVTPAVGTASQSWKQTFTFDRYGNRRFDAANTTTLAPGCAEAVCNPSVDSATNRLVGYTFDASGNTTVDAESRQFTYDAENKQVVVKDQYDNTIGEYTYDGDGKRVKKYVPATGELTIFVYDAGGKLIGEYSTEISETPKVSYTASDHLGSPRIITDENGMIVSRRDFMPFGEEIYTAERTQNLGYGADDIRQNFTSYERDNETDLDYAKARYHNYNHGRFTSPDDFLKDTKTIEPPSWNLYVYVRNNPLKYIDSSGESVDGSGLSDEERTRLIAEIARITGYRVEDLSFGSDGLLVVAEGARSRRGSATARRLLNEAIDSSWEFVLVGVNTTDVAFAEHVPVLKPPITRPDGPPVSGGVYGEVRIDFADFSNAVFEDDSARETFSLGIALLHEFVHGLYPALSDQQGGGAGQIESNWINSIREELGLPTRDLYYATSATFTNSQGQRVKGVQLSFTRFETIHPIDSSMTVPPENTFPVTTHVYWQLNTVGGSVRR